MAELSEGSEVLITLLDVAPADVALELQHGFLCKTMAQVCLHEGQRDAADRYPYLAEVVFYGVLDQKPEQEGDAWVPSTAIHGLGNLFRRPSQLRRSRSVDAFRVRSPRTTLFPPGALRVSWADSPVRASPITATRRLSLPCLH